jgi:hypothetical protein
MTATSKDKRDAMLGELESIRRLLQEDAQNDQDRDLLLNASNIPILMPELNIPTLLPDDNNYSAPIPVLTANPLDTMRVAAAKIAATAVRHHRNTKKETLNTSNPAPENIAPKNTQQLVDDIVRNALPRIETLLKEIVQEALEKEKL